MKYVFVLTTPLLKSPWDCFLLYKNYYNCFKLKKYHLYVFWPNNINSIVYMKKHFREDLAGIMQHTYKIYCFYFKIYYFSNNYPNDPYFNFLSHANEV